MAVQAQQVAINEIMYNPPGGIAEEEFLELFNPGPAAVNLAGWDLDDGVDFDFPPIVLGAGEYLVVAANVVAFQAKYPTVTNVIGGWRGRLSNRGERIDLRDASRAVIDRVDYSDEGEWTTREKGPLDYGHRGWIWSDAHDGGGKSLELISAAMPNEYGQNWAASLAGGGTPGRPNSVASAGVAPLIVDVNRIPIVPGSGQAGSVSARIIDELPGGFSATLYHRTDGAPTFTATPMLDDGLSGDGAAGDGVFGASMPGWGNGTIVEYYIQASDGILTRTLPAPSLVDGVPQQVTNYLYLVDDEGASAVVGPGEEPIYHIIMTEAERAELADIGAGGGDQNSDAQMNVTFISIDENGARARYNTGVRNRGHGSRDDPPNNYRVNFRHDRPWDGVTAINLNTKYTYLQLVGNRLFQLAGVESPQAVAVQVRVNGQNLAVANDEMFGSYVRVEVVDQDFADDHFPGNDDGNVYKCMRIVQPGANLRYQGEDPAPYRVNYFKRTNVTEDDWSDLVGLTTALNLTPDSVYLDEVNRVADLDQWLRFLAINAILDNAETTLANGNGDDYYMYRGDEDERFVLIQHDLDSIFGMGDSIGDPYAGIFKATAIPALDRLINHPEIAPRYYHHLLDLLQTVFAPGRLGPFLDDALGGWVPQPTINAMKAFLATRTAHIRSLIPAELTIQSDLPVINGYPRTTENTAALYGTAPAAGTRSVMVNGEAAFWSPVGGTWSIGQGSVGPNETLVPRGSLWRYLDDGSNQGTAWRWPSFNDAAWSSGRAQLGYGGNGEVTTIDFGTDASNKYITYYFRHDFHVTSASAFAELTLDILRDDGAVIYINGPEAERTNMGSGTVDYRTLAQSTVSGTDETRYYRYYPDATRLVEGRNVIAVEVHQILANSSDIGFDLELKGRRGVTGPTSGVALVPGINRIRVRAFDGPNGTGNELAADYIDVWYDAGTIPADVSGTLPSDTVLTRAGGPWRVTGDLIVPVGVTLTIEPGTTLFFETGTQMIVYGRMVCEGTETDRIRLTCNPKTGADWEGIVFDGTQDDNRMIWTDMDFADAGGEAVLVRNSRLLIEQMTWTDTDKTVLEIENSNLIVRNSILPNVNNNETVHGHDIPLDGYLIFENNVFGRTSGYSDVIDFTHCKRPDPILQILNNVFLGGGDDGLDLDGTDAHIEGNVFMNFVQDQPRDSSSNAIATGTDGTYVADLMIVRNIFINNDHDLLLKEESLATIQNNTFYGARIASINFDERNRPVTPGYGADIEGCIFRGMAALFQNQFSQGGEPDPVITIHRSIVPAAFHSLGSGNIDADPLFSSPVFHDFRLIGGSPAIGAGPNGLDMGGLVPAGASLSGEPPRFTTQRTATLTVAGPGIVRYRYSVDGGPYGAEIPVSLPIQLAGLGDGDHFVRVIGKNSAAVWQPEDEATRSKTWTINGVTQTLTVSEVMFNPPEGNEYEFIELHNTHPTVSLNLGTMKFTNGTTFTFPNGAAIPPGGYALAVRAGAAGNFAGFRAHYGLDDSIPLYGPYGGGLAVEGERVTLESGTGVELVSFRYESGRGWPVAADGAGHSLVPLDTQVQPPAGLDYGGNWRASARIGGSPGTADPPVTRGVVINELAANTTLNDPRYPDHDSNDWIELFNLSATDVNLTGWYLSDDAINLKKWAIPATATLSAGGRLSFDEITGFHNPLRAGFGIDRTGERLFLSWLPGTAGDRVVDAVRFKGQESGVSLGRFFDGDTYWYPTPLTRDASNQPPDPHVVVSEVMFHPSDDSNANEYIELFNPTMQTVEFWNAAGEWRLDGGGDYLFPPGTTIAPGGRLLIVNFDPSDTTRMNAFKALYGTGDIPAPVFGPFGGNLSNKGERAALERPLPPDLPGDLPAWVIVDEVIYFDRAPWTNRADGSGLALQRLSPFISGNDPTNWTAGSPSPGDGPPVVTYSLAVNAVNGTVRKSPDWPRYPAGSWVTLTATPAAGYHFVRWTGDVSSGRENEDPLVLAMNENKSLATQFAINPPDAPVVAAEPPFTRWLSNAIVWTLPARAAAFWLEWATDSAFVNVVGNSGWRPFPSYYAFATDLHDGQIYYYHVKARNAEGTEGQWSNVVSSTQDASPPSTQADPLPQTVTTPDVLVSWSGGDTGSGLASVRLFYHLRGTTGPLFTRYGGEYTNSPIVFDTTRTGGDGVYFFYTAGRDNVGNYEPAPWPPDARTVVKTVPDAPTFPSQPAYHRGTVNTVRWNCPEAAVECRLEWATDPAFANLVGHSGWLVAPTNRYDVTGLAHGTTYYYRVKARGATGRESPWSELFSSTPDAVAPESRVQPLPARTKSTTFTLTCVAGDTLTSVVEVRLFYRSYVTGPFQEWPTAFVDNALVFDASAVQGEGRYAFYSIAVDYVGNVEAAPAVPDAGTIVQLESQDPSRARRWMLYR